MEGKTERARSRLGVARVPVLGYFGRHEGSSCLGDWDCLARLLRVPCARPFRWVGKTVEEAGQGWAKLPRLTWGGEGTV